MNQTEIMRQLREPFPFEEIETKVQVTSGDKTKGLVVFYLDARAVQERLDKVLEPFGWRNEYIMWHEKSQICGLSIYNAERGEWIVKFDGAENSDIEAVKGGLTDAFKRSAVLWGVGRYLYQIEGVWVEVEQRGKGSYIKDSQQTRLKNEYDKAVSRIFANIAGQHGSSAALPTKQPATQSAPQNTTTTQPSAPDKVSDDQTPASPTDEYKVHSIKPSGKSSQLLELLDGNGEVVTAYVKTGDQSIVAGSRLRNVRLERKNSSYGEYNLITGYEAA